MHELNLCRHVVTRILAHPEVGSAKITEVRLALDPGHDLDAQRLQEAFDIASVGTAAAGARLRIRAAPAGEIRIDSVLVNDERERH